MNSVQRFSPSHRRWSPAPPPLVLITDPVRLPAPGALINRLPPGAAVLLRPYGLDGSARAGLVRSAARVAGRRRLAVLLGWTGGPAAIPPAVSGLHLPEAVARRGGGLARALLWRRAKRCRTLSVAAHGRMGLARAMVLRADFAFLSPVFPTASHPGAAATGPVRAALWARAVPLPVVALGGINRRSGRRLPPGAFRGVAALSGLMR